VSRLTILLVVAASLVVLTPSSGAGQPTASIARTCGGTVEKTINGHTIRAHGITTYNASCKGGKRVIRSFLKKADLHQSCNHASKQPPPTKGCVVRHFHCFRNGSTYCATPSSKSVSWKE
jgi:hypothetical protein